MITTERIRIPYKFIPRPYQIPVITALDDGIKRACLIWHRRAGKDLTMLNYAIRCMFPEAPNGRIGTYYHLFPTYAQGKKTIWDGIDGDGVPFLDHFPKQFIKSKNETELRIELVNGSAYQIIGTDKFDSIVGPNPVGCIFSEYALQTPSAWELLRPILLENHGWAVFIFTPRGQNHAYALYQMAKESPDWFHQILTVRDTYKEDGSPVISEDDIERERKEGMPEELIQQEYYASFLGFMEGSYYSRELQKAEAEGRITNIPHDPRLLTDTWWDLGIGDSTAIWFTQVAGKEIRVIDYYEATGEGLAFYAKVLKEKPYVYGRHHAPHDIEVRELSTGKSRKEIAQSLGINFDVVPNFPIEDGINAVRTIFPRLWIDKEKCEKGLNALRSYRKEWNEKLQEFKDRPRHDWSSHAADAFRYFAIGFREPDTYYGRRQEKAESEFSIFHESRTT